MAELEAPLGVPAATLQLYCLGHKIEVKRPCDDLWFGITCLVPLIATIVLFGKVQCSVYETGRHDTRDRTGSQVPSKASPFTITSAGPAEAERHPASRVDNPWVRLHVRDVTFTLVNDS